MKFLLFLLLLKLSERSEQIDLSPRALWNQEGITVAGWRNGSNGSLISQLTHPLEIAVNNDRLFVSDSENHRLIIVSLNDLHTKKIDNDLSLPRGMSIVDENVYLVHSRCTVEKISLIEFNRTCLSNSLAPFSPTYMFTNDAIDFYMSDILRHEVKRFRYNDWTNGQTVAGNGTDGTANNQFNRPYGIFVDRIGSLYVADCHNHRIMLWLKNSQTGIIVAGDGTPGTSLNKLSTPTQIIVDSNGFMYISESGNRRITRWAYGFTSGVCLVGCGESATGSNQLSGPHSLTFDKNGSLYVNDRGNHRIQKFQILNYTEKEPAQLQVPFCPMKDVIGLRCNTSIDPCQLLKPCKSKCFCQRIDSYPGYTCVCPDGLTEKQCDHEDEICPPNFCRNGICQKTNESKFICQCVRGWTGIYCETMIDYCQNVTCQNRGVCRRLLLEYRCECLVGSFSGRHCEIVEKKVKILKIVSKSFAYVAIIALSTVAIFVITMDLLKYCFGIDPVRREREEIRQKKKPRKKEREEIRLTPNDYVP